MKTHKTHPASGKGGDFYRKIHAKPLPTFEQIKAQQRLKKLKKKRRKGK